MKNQIKILCLYISFASLINKWEGHSACGILSDKTLSLDVDFIWILFFVYLIIKFDT